MSEPIIKVVCPRCHNTMKYQSQNSRLLSKVKRCVYCGYSIRVVRNLAPQP